MILSRINILRMNQPLEDFFTSCNTKDIDASTILLNGTITPLLEAKRNGHSVKEFVVRFDRVTVASWIYQRVGTQREVSLTITGELKDGTTFEGTDTIWVLWRGYSSSYKR